MKSVNATVRSQAWRHPVSQVLVGLLAFLFVSSLASCSGQLEPPHASYLGHWKRVAIETVGEDPSLVTAPSSGTDLYVDVDTITVVPGPDGSEAQDYRYWLKEIDAERFAFLSCSDATATERCSSIQISEDRTEFQRTFAITDTLSIRQTYAWVNGKVRPDAEEEFERQPELSSLSEPQKAYLGHWVKLGKDGEKGMELYIDPSSAWLVEPDRKPRWIAYRVSHVDTDEFTFQQCIQDEDKNDICSQVSFSEDRTEMVNTRHSQGRPMPGMPQILNMTVRQRFRKVDHKMTPF